MSRRAASFTQADLARAIRAVEQVARGRYRVRATADGVFIEPIELPEPPKETVAPVKEIVL